jgi:prepilin-type N-terminal cleavage/methylation domain-containing protein
MILQRLKQLNKQQGGFTLIELIVGVVLASMISIAVAMTMGLIFKVNASSSHRVDAIRQVQNAGMWITQDVQMAQTITIGGSHFLEVLWTDWDSTKYRVYYGYDTVVTNDLVRKYYVKHIVDTDYVLTSQTVVAHYIDIGSANTNIIESGKVYILTITAKISGLSANGQPVIETRTYEILPRIGS